MSDWMVAQLVVEAFAVNAEIEGYKAANALREMQGLAQAYDETAFDRKRIQLEDIAGRIRDRGQWL